MALVAYTDNVLTGRAFADRQRVRIDPSRELLALGAANVGAGLMQGFPVSSSGSRTAIGDAVGGRSQLAGLVTVVATVLAVLVARPVLAAFPTAALGAVVVYAAVRLVDVAEFRRLARFRRSEFLIAVATTAAVLVVGVLHGVLVAVGLSILDLLRRVARPHDAVEGFVPGMAGMHDVDDYPEASLVAGLIVYRYDSPLFFANAENFRTRARAAVARSRDTGARGSCSTPRPSSRWTSPRSTRWSRCGRTSPARASCSRSRSMKQDLRDSLAPTGLLERIGEDHLFPTLPTAVEAYHQWCTEHE